MVACSVLGCKSRSERRGKDVTFHAFPANHTVRKKWTAGTGRLNWCPSKHSRICSLHFEKEFITRKAQKVELLPGAVPSSYIPEALDTTISEMSDQTKTPIIDKRCRACLKVDMHREHSKIFDSWEIPYIGVTTMANELANLAGIEIIKSHGVPDIICTKCHSKLLIACEFASLVRKSHDILMTEVSSIVINAESEKIWPKPIQLDKNINGEVFEGSVDVEVKQEVMSDEEFETGSVADDVDRPELAMDIKIEPEEIIQPTIPVCVNGTIDESPIAEPEEKCLNSVVKEEPMSEDEELPLDCMLCAKIFYSVSGLKAHVIAQHSYKTVKRKMGNSPSPERKRVDCYTCGTCQRKFTTSTDLTVHETCHNKFVCYLCRATFDTFAILTKHSKKCKVCTQVETPKVKTMEDVMRPLHPLTPVVKTEDEEVKENDLLKCTLCDEKFSDSYYMTIHHEIHHSTMQDGHDCGTNEAEQIETEQSEPKDAKFEPKTDNTETDSDKNLFKETNDNSCICNSNETSENIGEPNSPPLELSIEVNVALNNNLITNGDVLIKGSDSVTNGVVETSDFSGSENTQTSVPIKLVENECKHSGTVETEIEQKDKEDEDDKERRKSDICITSDV